MPLQIVATDSVPGRTLTYSAAQLPAGISINSSTGLITGTPTTAQTKHTVVTVTDNTGLTGTASFSWTVNPSGGTNGTKAYVGATVDTVYGGSEQNPPNLAPAMTTFDSRVGRNMAQSSTKIFFNNPTFSKGTSGTPGQWPTDTNHPKPILNIQNQMNTAGTGGRMFICFRPAVDFTGAYTAPIYATEKANLKAAIKLYQNANINFCVALWQECNNIFLNGFASDGSTHQAMWAYYAPTVKSLGVPLVYLPAMNSGGSPKAWTLAVPFFPHSPNPDAVVPDWYSNDAFNAGVTLTAIESKTDTLNLPFGLAEFGPSNDPSHFSPTHAQWYNGPSDHTSFCQQIIDIFKGRITAGKNNWDIVYYSDVANNMAIGYIPNSSDYKVAGLQAIFDNLAVNA
jgi:hypothetical protein